MKVLKDIKEKIQAEERYSEILRFALDEFHLKMNGGGVSSAGEGLWFFTIPLAKHVLRDFLENILHYVKEDYRAEIAVHTSKLLVMLQDADEEELTEEQKKDFAPNVLLIVDPAKPPVTGGNELVN